MDTSILIDILMYSTILFVPIVSASYRLVDTGLSQTGLDKTAGC